MICTEVIEHVADDEAALDNLTAMTGRYLLLSVPTGHIYPLESGFGHLRHYDLQELCGRLRSRGLSIKRAEAWGFPFMSLFKWAANLESGYHAEGVRRWRLEPGEAALGQGVDGVVLFERAEAGAPAVRSRGAAGVAACRSPQRPADHRWHRSLAGAVRTGCCAP